MWTSRRRPRRSRYAEPKAELLVHLVDSVAELEDKPFGQYWGIQAIGRVLAATPEAEVDPKVNRELRLFLARLDPGTDRYYALSRILSERGII